MFRGKVIKKRTKNRLTLLRNLRKGKARKEPRCNFQIIPYPLKFMGIPRIYRLYADVILMEYNNKIVSECSLLNFFKIYKHAQIINYSSQKLLKILVENKDEARFVNWKAMVEKFSNSESSEIKAWAEPIRLYSQRYEATLEEFKRTLDHDFKKVLQSYIETNERTEKARLNLFKTYPCMQLKFQMKENQIQISEMIYSERFLTEMGYSFDSFITAIFQEGMPKIFSFDEDVSSSIARLRLDKFLKYQQDGYQSKEFESCIIMKGGYLKKVKFCLHYHSTYEKDEPGFTIIATIIAKQKPFLDFPSSMDLKINSNFIELMSQREIETENFLLSYYNQRPEQKYINWDKVCKIKAINNEQNATP